MAITLIQSPKNWGRVYDTMNRCTYTFQSDKYTEPGYNFLIELYKFKIDVTGYTSSSKTLIGVFKMYPLSNGTCEFNPTSVYKNYITSDFNASTTLLTDCENSFGEFGMEVYDFYTTGTTTTPCRQGSPWVEPGRGTIFYNGVQQQIPYDYTPLNFLQGDNFQWVMSGDTNYPGSFLTDASEFRLDNEDIAFLYFLCDKNNLPTKIRYTYYYLNTVAGVSGAINAGHDLDRLIGLPSDFWNEESRMQSMTQVKTSPSNYEEQISIDDI